VETRFTDADRALLEELEDEALVTELFARQARGSKAERAEPDKEALPRRSSVLISGLRGLEGGAEAVSAAGKEGGDVSSLFPLLLTNDLVKRPPQLVHAIAVYFDRLATTYARDLDRAKNDEKAALREQYLHARTRSLAAFIALYAERSYIAEYGKRVAGSALPRDQAEAAASSVAQGCLEHLGTLAQKGALELTSESALALVALSLTPEACRIGGVDDNTTKWFSRRAESIRANAIDSALSPAQGTLNEIRVRGVELARLVPAFQRVRDIWLWSGFDEAVERFAVDEVTGTAWIIYRQSNWNDLRALLTPCIDLYESLARRIESDPKRHVAYSAKCAQVFVFRSDCETDRTIEWAHAERSIKLCPTHRNGRLSVAHLLANRAISRLGSTWFPSAADVEAARADIARAEELFPQSTRIGPAKAKLKEVTDKMSGGSR